MIGKWEKLRSREVSYFIVCHENDRELWQGVGLSFVIDILYQNVY